MAAVTEPLTCTFYNGAHGSDVFRQCFGDVRHLHHRLLTCPDPALPARPDWSVHVISHREFGSHGVSDSIAATTASCSVID